MGSIRRLPRKNKAVKVGTEEADESFVKTFLEITPRVFAKGKSSQESSKRIADRRGGQIHHEGIRRSVPPAARSIVGATGEDDEASHDLERNSHEKRRSS